jgi:hypothetical protein
LQADHDDSAGGVHFRNAADNLHLSPPRSNRNPVAHGDLRSPDSHRLIVNRPIAYQIGPGSAYRTIYVLVRSPDTLYTAPGPFWIKFYFASRQFSPVPISTSNGTSSG